MQRTSFLQFLLVIFFAVIAQTCCANNNKDSIWYNADNAFIQYTGRIDFSNTKAPKAWQPGVYMQVKFKGSYCYVVVEDEELWGNHNYLAIVIDNQAPIRIQTKQHIDTIRLATNLSKGVHTLTIAKNTEAGIGYIAFKAVECKQLLQPSKKPIRKIEYFGNSITCGTGSDQSLVACDKGKWHDQHNAYMSYGAITARALNAQYHLSAVSGIGLIHSCCNMNILMPKVYDKINMRNDSLQWNFNQYIPDVVTICLGQNDGVQDSATFCNAYITFLQQLRLKYSHTKFILLSSPMADETLLPIMKKYIAAVEETMHQTGDQLVYHYYFSHRFHHGCGNHPDLLEHQEIAKELTAYIEYITGW